jgi:hypothetical protein
MEIIRELGAYAGLAAFIGLAVLALLYFAQARDVRRLRENAEFLVEGEGPEGAPSVPPPIGAEEDTAAGARDTAPPATDAEAFRRAELSRQAAKRRERFEERRTGGPGEGFEIPSTAVIVIGALILLAGIGFGATRLLGGDDETAGGGAGGKDLACPPGQTKVAVLNGTAEDGLAGASAAKLKQKQYDVGPIGNTDNAFDTSTIMFDQGNQACAPEIGAVVGISGGEQMDQEIQGIAEGAAVAVILGEDQVSGSTSSDDSSTETTDSGTLGE